MTTAPPDRLDRIEALVEANAKAISELKAESQKWDERFFQLTQDTLGTAKTIIVTAGIVVIFSPILQALAPAIEKIVARVLEAV